jgi:lipopolysaccharide transport system ATP-binding protein
MQFAISVENLSKRYRLGQGYLPYGGRGRNSYCYRTLRETIMEAVAATGRRLSQSARRANTDGRSGTSAGRGTVDFWALKDVSFEVEPGEVVGIVGRNGAGKSTLLKILSRITDPTSGRAQFRGRIGSLLEVGTGFHQELTGRENIYLNGSILGMSQREISRRFDEIVAFSEIEEFLDTPVKRYSSGMFVRLAFGVAAHLEPEILLVDEVLAVGDQRFQRKCLGKMRDVGRSGRTVLFVSHNIAALEALCGRCILIDRGQVKAEGDTRSILARYYEDDDGRSTGCRDLTEHHGRTQSSEPTMLRVTLSDGNRSPISCIKTGSSLSILVDVDVKGSPIQPVLGVGIRTNLGVLLVGVNSRTLSGCELGKVHGPATITCRLDDLPLMPGSYLVDLLFSDDRRDIDVVYNAITFDVVPADDFNAGDLPPDTAGPIFWPATWDQQANSSQS